MTHLKKCYISRLCTSQPLPGAGGLCVSAVCECLTLHKSVWVACLFDCFLWPWRSAGRGTLFFFLFFWKTLSGSGGQAGCIPLFVLIGTSWREEYDCGHWEGAPCSITFVTNQTPGAKWGSWVLSFGAHGPDISTKLDFWRNSCTCFFCYLFFCMCLWAHPRRVFDRKAANMLLFAHKYGAGMTLSRLWMYSCQDNSQATAAPELDLYTSAQNAGVMVGRICPWLLLTSLYGLQCLDLVGVEPAAALCDV